jgi:DNA-binding NarL/FixJ family response regulator
MPKRQQRTKNTSDVLTSREQDIASLVVTGLSNKEIARHANLVEGTVKVHLHQIYKKVGVSNRTALAAALMKRRRLN